ncbi:MAG: PHP domain-containing protein [Deltaproteobacteria bacterium]|nr:PHP domain-containing protein [Deltaproteobacteria bacterium]
MTRGIVDPPWPKKEIPVQGKKAPPAPRPENGRAAAAPVEADRRRPLEGPTGIGIDMHLHSDYSDAPRSKIENIEAVCREKDIGVAVTDHNEIRGAVKLAERGKTLMLPAIEVGSEERLEILVYFLDIAQLEDFYRREVEPYKRHRYYTKLGRSFTKLIPRRRSTAGSFACRTPTRRVTRT